MACQQAGGKWIGSTVDPAALLRRVAEQALTLVPGAEGALVGFVDGQHIAYVCGSGYLAGASGTRTAIGASIGGLAVRTGQVQVCGDVETDRRVDREAARRLGTRSTVVVPLTRGTEALGVLAVGSTRTDAFTGDDVNVLAAMAELVGVAVAIAAELGRAGAELDRSAGVPTPGSRFLLSVLDPHEVAADEARRSIESVLERPEQLSMVFQPIVDLHAGDRVVAVEALSRFDIEPYRTPDLWFHDAHEAGLGVDLELRAVVRALSFQPLIARDVAIAVNVGPDLVMSDRLCDVLQGVPPHQVILELTEHTATADYPRLQASLRRLRKRGVRLSIDDTGSGYSSLARILKLAPEFIKLDRDLTSRIDLDPVRRALAASLVAFARDTGASIVAEGIETADELDVLRDLGIPFGQGYHLGRPAPIEAHQPVAGL